MDLFLKTNFLRKKIEYEFERQWDLFCDLVQDQPDYLDSHHHIHQFPIISDAILNVLSRIKLKQDFFIRNTANLVELDSLFIKRAILNFFGNNLKKKISKFNFTTNSSFTGFYDYENEQLNLKIVNLFLRNINCDTLMMVHPSIGDTPEIDDLMKVSRESEFSLLMSDEFIDLISKLGFEISYKLSP